MKAWIDLHIHSVLSPCGDDDMTPGNIVGMAKISGLDAIALTDHNCAKNCPAAEAVGKELELTVISGMELETAEEVHVVMLFPSSEKALECGREVDERRFKIANKPDIYGHQIIMNEIDEPVGEENDLLITATDIGVYEVVALAKKYGGVAIPAHVDKYSHGIIQILGDIHDDMGFTSIEVSKHADQNFINMWKDKGYNVLIDSDAHYLSDINDNTVNFLELDEVTPESIINKLAQRR